MPLFYVLRDRRHDTQQGLAEAGGEQIALNYGRVVLGLGLVAIPMAAAFLARFLHWDDGASVFLHMSELAFGGLVGLVLGERLGIEAHKQ